MMESDEEDSDDGRTMMTGATKFTEMTGRTGKSIRTAAIERHEQKTLRSKAASTLATTRTKGEGGGPRLTNDRDGNVLDMLDPGMGKSVRLAAGDDGESDGDSGAMEFDDVGRLIVPDDMEESSAPAQKDDDEVDDENLEICGLKKRRISKFESAKNTRDEVQRAKNSKKKGAPTLGAAYKSRKSGGDVQKKNQQFEPYVLCRLMERATKRRTDEKR